MSKRDRELEGWGCAESDEAEFDRLLRLAEANYANDDDPDLTHEEFQLLQRED